MTAGVVVAGLAVSGCAPVKMGAAAIVGNSRVSIAQLNTETGFLTAAAKKNPPQQGPLTQQEITQRTLGWLIQFQITDQLASQHGISVTAAQGQAAIKALVESEAAEEQEQGSGSASSVSIDAIMIANGIPPNLETQLGRWLAIGTAYELSANGGKEPTSQAQATAAESKYSHATCEAAKSLNIQVNPQFGALSYSNYTVVDAPGSMSLASGVKPAAKASGLTPAC